MYRCLSLDTNHTAKYIADCLQSIITKFDIDDSKIVVIVTDSAANMKKAVSLINPQKQLGCFAHTLSHLVPYTLSNVPSIREIINKVKTIVTLVIRSVVASDELRRLQLRDGKSEGTALKFIQDCPIRWNSTFYMLERFLILQEYVYAVLSKCQNAPNMLTRKEI